MNENAGIPDSISINSDSDASAEPTKGIAAVKKDKKERSWVYLHAEKLEIKGKEVFKCLVDNHSGKKCKQIVDATAGNTSTISRHLKNIHHLKPAKKLVQTQLSSYDNLPKMRKPKSFRQAVADFVAKQYLPFSIIEQKVFQDMCITFHHEWLTTKTQPTFITDKTVAADIAKMADHYIAEMSKRFKSKLSLSMDAWTGPNKMSFLGITFTYLDENFHIQRGLLEMVKMKEKHSGKYMAKLFQQALSLYGIEKDMINGVTQDNASNCGTCIDALVKDGFDRSTFYGCFLHILNLACQAAIKVYDPAKKSSPVRRTVLRNLDGFSDFSDLSESEDSQDEEDPDYDENEMIQFEEDLQDVSNKSKAILHVIIILI
jgi:hypothetical protein